MIFSFFFIYFLQMFCEANFLSTSERFNSNLSFFPSFLKKLSYTCLSNREKKGLKKYFNVHFETSVSISCTE